MQSLDFTRHADFDSVCSETMVGTMQRRGTEGYSNTDMSCFFGKQDASQHHTAQGGQDDGIAFVDEKLKEETVKIEKDEARNILKWINSHKKDSSTVDPETLNDLNKLVEHINSS